MQTLRYRGRQPEPILINPTFIRDARLSRAAKGLMAELLDATDGAQAPEGDAVEGLLLELLIAGYVRWGGDLNTPPDKMTLEVHPYGDSGFSLQAQP